MANSNKLINRAFSIVEISIVVAIIGVILAVIVAGNGFLRQSRLAKAVHLTKTAPIFEIYDKRGNNAVLAWYEASDVNNFEFASSASFEVSKWLDISGNGNHLSAYSGTQEPTWNESLINGLPAVKFERDDQDQMNKAGGIIPYAKSEATMIAVYSLESKVQSVMFAQNANSPDDPFAVRIDSDLEAQLHTATTTEVSKALSEDVPYIMVARIKVTSNLQSCLLSQNSRVCDATAASSEFKLGNASFVISDHQASASADMYLAELIIFNKAILSEELAIIKQYLGSKYNIPINNDPSLNN